IHTPKLPDQHHHPPTHSPTPNSERPKKVLLQCLSGRVRQCFSAVSDGLTCLAGERPVVDDKQARVAETLKKLHRGDMDIIAYEDEHKFDGDGDEPA
ncbi:hypothetical protein PMO97_10640, partial [Bifidobacterium longum]|nr:hypothetical protein [Bifidobacterium longum]MDB6595422.1 hypothetical protein [Bifidobacterium longum]